MITDARALRLGFVPQDLEHRDGQIDYLSTIFEPLRNGRKGEHVCIHGPSGAGKTTLAKYTLDQLKSQTFGIRWGYVNCMSDSAPGSVLFELVRDAGLGRDLRREGTPTAAALDYFRNSEDQIVLVIDEVDVLDDIQTLLALYEQPNVTLVCITLKQTEWLADMDPRAESRFRCIESLQLDKYSYDELVDILESRVSHGLIRSRVEDRAIETIADIAAGDARHGITLLRRSARQASREERDLTVDIVDSNVKAAQEDLEDHRIRYYGTHKRALYEIIKAAGEIDSKTLHRRYEQRVKSPKAKSTRRKYLGYLKRYDEIDSVGNGPATTYRYVR